MKQLLKNQNSNDKRGGHSGIVLVLIWIKKFHEERSGINDSQKWPEY